MTIEQQTNMYESVYGKNAEYKSADAMAAAPAKRTPNAGFKSGDIIEFPSEVKLVEEDFQGRKFDTTAILKTSPGQTQGQAVKFFISWISNPGYACYLNGSKEQLEAAVKAGAVPTQNNDSYTTGHVGDLPKMWQDAGTQAAAAAAIANKKFQVTIEGYYLDQFNLVNPKPRYRFTLIP